MAAISQDNEEPPSKVYSPIFNQVQTGINSALAVGLSTYVFPDLSIKIVTDLASCRTLFEAFSPKDSLFTTWDFRFAWYAENLTKPVFWVFSQKEKPVALLPLWLDLSTNRFVWFGSDWQEDNTFWTFDKNLIPVMLANCPRNTYLNALKVSPETVQLLNLKPDDPKFVLDLTNINSLDDFLSRFDKKKRYNLRRDYQNISNQGVEVIKNRFTDIDNLIRFANCRFGDQSLWTPPITKAFQWLSSHQSSQYRMEMLTFQVGQLLAGFDLNFIYKDTYYAAKCGYDVSGFPGIGNFATLTDIDIAIKSGCKKIDFLQSVGGLVQRPWKADWFTTIPLYKFSK